MQHNRNYIPRWLHSQRGFFVTALALGALAYQPVSANYSLPLDGCRSLALCNLYSGESPKTAYWEKIEYPSSTPEELGQLFRDHLSNNSR